MSDPSATGYPQWQTGEELAVALPGSIAVATRGDASGRVIVEVWTDHVEAAGVELRLAYEGELLLTSESGVIGNTVGNEFHAIQLSSGRHYLRVFISGPSADSDAVYFVVED